MQTTITVDTVTHQPMRVKNLWIHEWCPQCGKPKSLSFTTIIGGTYSADEPGVVELPAQCICSTFAATQALSWNNVQLTCKPY